MYKHEFQTLHCTSGFKTIASKTILSSTRRLRATAHSDRSFVVHCSLCELINQMNSFPTKKQQAKLEGNLSSFGHVFTRRSIEDCLSFFGSLVTNSFTVDHLEVKFVPFFGAVTTLFHVKEPKMFIFAQGILIKKTYTVNYIIGMVFLFFRKFGQTRLLQLHQ